MMAPPCFPIVSGSEGSWTRGAGCKLRDNIIKLLFIFKYLSALSQNSFKCMYNIKLVARPKGVYIANLKTLDS
jgi:hypothetical protein